MFTLKAISFPQGLSAFAALLQRLNFSVTLHLHRDLAFAVFLKLYYFFCLHVLVLACMYVQASHMCYPLKARVGVSYPGTGDTSSCGPGLRSSGRAASTLSG